ncbi:MAG: hypothetical protein WA183_19920, partial [Chthoniobacterales bacterium]
CSTADDHLARRRTRTGKYPDLIVEAGTRFCRTFLSFWMFKLGPSKENISVRPGNPASEEGLRRL